jgi:REP element-mobilizing transposase RayT
MEQLGLGLKFRGGKRKGAGRKPVGKTAGVSHRARPKVDRHTPAHVTLKVLSGVPNLRKKKICRGVEKAAIAGAEKSNFRITEFSVQGDHIHMMSEADDNEALARGMQGLKVRIAKAVNNLLGRVGTFFKDRYHAHVLKTPTEVRNALNYIRNNAKKHAEKMGIILPENYIDPCSSTARNILPQATCWLLRKGIQIVS